MSDYKEHVYDESFEDSIHSFDQYVQESALIIGGIIVGIVAFIGLIIFAIKKIFFSKDTLNGGNLSVTRSLLSIKSLLDGPNVPQTIKVAKGIKINELDATQTFGITQMILSKLDNLITELEADKTGKNVDRERLKAWTSQFQTKEQIEANIHWVEDYTYSTTELRDNISKSCDMAKQVSSQLNNLDKRYKKLQKDTTVDKELNEYLTKSYKMIVDLFNVSAKTHTELHNQLKNGIANGGDA